MSHESGLVEEGVTIIIGRFLFQTPLGARYEDPGDLQVKLVTTQ